MAAQDFDATAVPQDVVAVLSLTNGKSYTCQNVSTTSTLFVREQAAMPDVTDRAFKIESGGHVTIKPDGTPVWMWSDPDGAAVIVEEAV